MQFDVFRNPITRARRVMPFITLLQSDAVRTEQDRVVAFIAEKALIASNGRLTPTVVVQEREYLLLIQSVTNLSAADLRRPIDNIAAHRDQIVRGLDWLFLGV